MERGIGQFQQCFLQHHLFADQHANAYLYHNQDSDFGGHPHLYASTGTVTPLTPTPTFTTGPVPCGSSSGPLLNMQIVCNSLGSQSQNFGVRIYNYGTTAFTLANISVVLAWLLRDRRRESWILSPTRRARRSTAVGGSNNVNISNTSTHSHGAYPVCTAVAGHYANQAVTFTIGSGEHTVQIPPNGVLLAVPKRHVSNSAAITPPWTAITGRMIILILGRALLAPTAAITTQSYYAIYYNGTLINEVTDAVGDIDPNTGLPPCTTPAPTCTPTPTNTSSPTVTPHIHLDLYPDGDADSHE